MVIRTRVKEGLGFWTAYFLPLAIRATYFIFLFVFISCFIFFLVAKMLFL